LPSRQTSQTGLLFGLAAYGLWGLIPLYFKAVAYAAPKASPLEVLAHRALWSFVFLAVLVRFLGRWTELGRQMRNPRVLAVLSLNALLIAVNWLTFIYAVVSNQVLQSSLGYFINPLVTVLLGMLFLRERLRPYQIVSIAVATIGVLIMAGLVEGMPWIALTLAFSFALYALMRKLTPVDGLLSVTVETLVLSPIALIYLGDLAFEAGGVGHGPGAFGVLMLSGLVTTVPLLFFAGAARRLTLSTLGILQYLTPSMQFLLAVAVFREAFTSAQLVSFACIWTAIGIYTADSFRAARQPPPEAPEPIEEPV